VSLDSTGLHSIRTYERGVEGETLSCGTGVTAAAIAIHQQNAAYKSPISLHTKGGLLKVHFTKVDQEYSKIFLEGPAEFVFKGEISI
jgi:diaminopimelate epimerase